MPTPFGLARGLCLCLCFSLLAIPATGANLASTFDATGEGYADWFGHALASGGDVDGDSHPDLIVGANPHDTAGLDAGRVYVYFGGPGADATADLVLDGSGPGEHFGCSAAIVGDVNADNYDDFVIGAYGASSLGAYTGRAYVYFGGPALDGIADLVLEGQAANEWFGYAVSAAGDLNDDTYPDFAVTALEITAASSAGRVLVYFGGPAVDSVADLLLDGENDGDRFGWAITSPGDVDDDGIGDLLVGATRHDAVATDAGRVYLYSGGSTPSTAPSLTIDGAGAEAEFGSSLIGGRDWDGDGQPDLVIGARLHPQPLADCGRVYVYAAGSQLDAQWDVMFPASSTDRSFGQSLAFVEDMDGDGRDEILIGSSGTELEQGAAYVFASGPSPDTSVDLLLLGDDAGDGFGFRVVDLGDFDANGVVDYAVSAIYDDEGGLDTGTVSVFAHPFDPPLYSITEPLQDEQWIAGTSRLVGWTGASYPAINISFDDGATWDLLANVNRSGTSFLVTTPAVDAPAARLALSIPGQPVSPLTSDIDEATFSILLPPPQEGALAQPQGTSTTSDGNAEFATSVAYVGDVNGDGNEDILVGAPRDGSGEARLFLSPPNGANWNLTFDRHTNDVAFGEVVAALGDINDDSFADWAIADPEHGAGGSDIGRVYVYFGGSPPNTQADLVLSGDLAGHDEFGHDVCATGDLNADGYADFAVSASSLIAFSDDEVHVFFGGPSLDDVPDRTFHGNDPNDYFGAAIAGVGDVNGDGYDDLAIGSPHENPTGGVIFMHYGGPGFDTNPDLQIPPPMPYANLGYELASAGDFNGDGYQDMAVGADYERTYVFFGGPGFGFGPPWVIDVGSSCTNCPAQLTGGADLNGDGYDDLVVGVEPTVYVFHGGATPDGIADVTLTEPEGIDFGDAVSVTTLPSSDGLGRLAVGDPFYDYDPWNFTGRGKLYTYRFRRYELLEPNGGETWQAGQNHVVQWEGTALADIELALDGGVNFDHLLASGVGGLQSNAVEVTLPLANTNEARIRIKPTDPTLLGDAVSASTFTIEGVTGLDGDLPVADWLGVPQPNPFPAGQPVVFPAALRRGGDIELRIFDVRGRRVASVQGRHEPGLLSFRWRPDQRLASGIYFAQMSRNGETVATTRWTLLR